MHVETTHALNRFGFGPRPDEQPPSDVRGWLRDQIHAADSPGFPADLPSGSDGLRLLAQQRMRKIQGDTLVNPVVKAETVAQMGTLLTTDQPFRERLVWFWANHFTVSTRQGGTRATIGAYVREAIRPHVTGRFADMLHAVMRHPAMLMYLDNASSIGPNSPVGLKQHRGLNENLARECLELHTLSPASGYTQADVTSFAAILTGWSVDLKAETPGFVFRDNAHEPGSHAIMGTDFPPGEAGGLAALDWLATHPATYRHLATQMAAHFVGENPAPSAIAQLERALRATQGNLGTAALALVDLPDAWRPGTRFRAPFDYTLAVARALSMMPDAQAPHPGGLTIAGGMRTLGQPLWGAPLPNGWSDRAADWSQPADMMARADWAYSLSAHVRDGPDPIEIARAMLGPALRPATATAIHHAGGRTDALTLLFTAPEFQRC
ncbi:hypothetical protein AA103196_2481 [Ameyamaea chiangmaiensis NBRC 103196]|uniref:DUF1800 domain-containing protein n=1 Tax=Ameyamaea chiangmaiensis TaxID=442969 RepID=A0A850PG19_9PROT|nr:DUF1800 domain-containing protein [Ameyamaea chiangmaiensis]MBS4075716.1 DUF1800 domain-containing protein [Ameyamaea chiangmaiensis]NVN41166.1 DUF1800 domain-containing protein [Ameyamaea chiangmaiensis]GBQ70402.1 hypothetical protein AA103196_2481 [Ameyamaea chiangmaiensis NBRC 103196]